MAFPVKVLMDEIFGYRNFRNWITRKKCNTKNYTRKQFGNISDYILFYGKSDNWVWNQPIQPWDEAWANREYQCVDGQGRRYKKVPVHAPGTRNGATGQPWRGILPPSGGNERRPIRPGGRGDTANSHVIGLSQAEACGAPMVAILACQCSAISLKTTPVTSMVKSLRPGLKKMRSSAINVSEIRISMPG